MIHSQHLLYDEDNTLSTPNHERIITMGVSTHSTPRTAFILSAWHSPERHAKQNERLHYTLGRDLKRYGFAYKELLGKYKGESECSYIVTGGGVVDMAFIEVLAREFEQESYLVLENHKHGIYKATFIYLDQEQPPVVAGYLRSLDKAIIDALKLDYSFRPDTGDYFTIWPADTTVMKDLDQEIKKALAGAGRIPGIATNHDVLVAMGNENRDILVAMGNEKASKSAM